MVANFHVKTKSSSRLRDERGSAMIETVPLLMIFIVLLGFGLGFFGVIQTAIMNSMAARTYAFETFRNRADLTIFRDTTDPGTTPYAYTWGSRFHAVSGENTSIKHTYATARPILFGAFRSIASVPTSGSQDPVTLHNDTIYKKPIQVRYRNTGVSPAWVMVGYGICLDANCGDI